MGAAAVAGLAGWSADGLPGGVGGISGGMMAEGVGEEQGVGLVDVAGDGELAPVQGVVVETSGEQTSPYCAR